MKSCAANELNQYTSIDNPDAVGLRGSATNTATVTVNGNAALSDSIASDTVPWHYALLADNADSGAYTFASIMAVVNPPGMNTPDIVESTSGSVYAPPQAEVLAYDDDGNLLSDGRWEYTWNGENRLVKAEELISPTNREPYVVEYAYDHRGRLIWKTIASPNAPPSKTMRYLWDDYNIVAETVAQDTATKTTYNIWGLDLDGTLQGAGGVGGLLAVVSPLPLGEGQGEGSTVYLPCYDANGNVMEYVASDGTIVGHREYDPFGGTVVYTSQSAITNQQFALSFSHWFSTKPWCVVTGLSEYQYRKYSPVLGRWLSRDPIGEEGGVCLYGFTMNSPYILFDYLGLRTTIYGAGKIKVDDSCKGLDLSGITYLDEDDGRKLRPLPAPGGTVDADAIYFPDGTAVKIPDSGTVVIKCVCKDHKWMYEATFSNPIINPGFPEWKTGEPPPIKWPNPKIPPYKGNPPTEHLEQNNEN